MAGPPLVVVGTCPFWRDKSDKLKEQCTLAPQIDDFISYVHLSDQASGGLTPDSNNPGDLLWSVTLKPNELADRVNRIYRVHAGDEPVQECDTQPIAYSSAFKMAIDVSPARWLATFAHAGGYNMFGTTALCNYVNDSAYIQTIFGNISGKWCDTFTAFYLDEASGRVVCFGSVYNGSGTNWYQYTSLDGLTWTETYVGYSVDDDDDDLHIIPNSNPAVDSTMFTNICGAYYPQIGRMYRRTRDGVSSIGVTTRSCETNLPTGAIDRMYFYATVAFTDSKIIVATEIEYPGEWFDGYSVYSSNGSVWEYNIPNPQADTWIGPGDREYCVHHDYASNTLFALYTGLRIADGLKDTALFGSKDYGQTWYLITSLKPVDYKVGYVNTDWVYSGGQHASLYVQNFIVHDGYLMLSCGMRFKDYDDVYDNYVVLYQFKMSDII